ncbi:MAG TPA: sugar phosphate isomerase/epimerase family protein [Clostridia bacterium]|nr:sugar phosphate isomerase/epimerase family protein [Clostridia bacterium]
MKLGVSSYSLINLVRSGQIKQIDVISLAKDLGCDLIEFVPFILEENETNEDFAVRAKAECARVGIEMGSYTVGADFINGSDGDLDAEIQRVKGEVDIARLLGSKTMRHDATVGFSKEHTGPRDFDAALPRLIEGCRAVTEYAQEFGIQTMIENHGFFCQDSDRVEKLINGVDHPNFGLLLDMGNFVCVDESPETAMGRLMPYAFHVHAKDFHIKSGMHPDPGQGWFRSRGGNYLRGAIIGHGDVAIAQCLRIAKDSGYKGALSIEFEGMEDPKAGVGIGLENLRKYLALI